MQHFPVPTELEGTIWAFSKARHGEVLLAPNFRVKEFACKDGYDRILIDSRLPAIAQAVRDKYGAFTFTSAYRTPSYNRDVGGANYSLHTMGMAIDIPCTPLGITPDELADFLESLPAEYGVGGIGIYLPPKYNFVHVDTGNMRTWTKG